VRDDARFSLPAILLLVRVAEDFRIFSRMCLDSVQYVDIVLLVHTNDVGFHQIFIPIVDLKPMLAGLGQHRDSSADRGRDYRLFIDPVLL